MSAQALALVRAMPLDAHGRLLRDMRNILRAAPGLAGLPVDVNRDIALGRTEAAGLVLRFAGSTQHEHGVCGQPIDWDTVVTLEAIVRVDTAPVPAGTQPDVEGGPDADPLELALRLHAEAYRLLRRGLLQQRPDVSVNPLRIEADADQASERIGLVLAHYSLMHRTPDDRLQDCDTAALSDCTAQPLAA